MIRGMLLGMPVSVGEGIEPVGVGWNVMLGCAAKVVAGSVPMGEIVSGADAELEPGTEPSAEAVEAPGIVAVPPPPEIGNDKLNDGVLPDDVPAGRLVDSADPVLVGKLESLGETTVGSDVLPAV